MRFVDRIWRIRKMVKLTLIQGDCLKVLKKLPDESVDLVVTSPPYNIGIDYGKYWNDRMKWSDYWNWTKKWLSECYRVLKEDGRICINHYFSLGCKIGKKKGTEQGDYEENRIRVAPLFEIHKISMELGFKHHSVVVWQDITLSKKTAWGSWLSASSPYINSPYEGILIMYKKYWKKQNKGDSTIDSKTFVKLTRGIWDIPTETRQLTKACFPIELPSYCIKLLTYKNDTVLDPFLGSGTTMRACLELKRNCIGIEINPEYIKIIKKRLNWRKSLGDIEFEFKKNN